jgi:hypothetical protein
VALHRQDRTPALCILWRALTCTGSWGNDISGPAFPWSDVCVCVCLCVCVCPPQTQRASMCTGSRGQFRGTTAQGFTEFIICRVGQNHTFIGTYGVYMYKRYFWQGNHHRYGNIRCRYTVLANPNHVWKGESHVCPPRPAVSDMWYATRHLDIQKIVHPQSLWRFLVNSEALSELQFIY